MRQLLQEEFFNLYKKFEKTVKKLGDCAMKNGGAKNVARRFDNGASCLTRTGDTLINSQVL